jgi:hypothetical protein
MSGYRGRPVHRSVTRDRKAMNAINNSLIALCLLVPAKHPLLLQVTPIEGRAVVFPGTNYKANDDPFYVDTRARSPTYLNTAGQI